MLTVEEEKVKAATPGSDFKECTSGCPVMIVVPAGKFNMGSPEKEAGRQTSEGPQHEVTVAEPLAVSKFEVTFEEWDACVAATACPGASEVWERGHMPVINVSWVDAKKYVAWLVKFTGKHYRLLSEAEWEYCARGGTNTRYSWGDDPGAGNANTGEALLVAALVEHWFPQPFELDRFRNVLGLFGVAALGTVASQAIMAVMLELSGHTAAPFVVLWSRLVWATMTGIVMIAPILLGLAASARKPLSRREVIEGTAVLAFHTIASAHAFALLPLGLGRWMLLAPFTSQLPLFLWLSVRCGPLFASAGSLVLGLSILGSFTLERGRFADANFHLDERLAATDFTMLATAFVALAIAALIAERKDAELAASQG